MNLKNSIFLLAFFTAACQEKNIADKETVPIQNTAIQSGYLIEAKEFKPMAQKPGIKIIDFRSEQKYFEGHIEGAVHVKRSDIEDASFPYGGIMASPKQIESLFSTLGIANNDTLIIYDDNGLCEAARLWWILQNYDYNKVKLLHGGIEAWESQQGKITTESPVIKTSVFELPSTPSMKYYIAKEEVQRAIGAETVIIDTRNTDEYTGKKQKNGAAKAGRIPTSISIDWAEAVAYDEDKKFRPYQELEDLYGQLNLKKDDPIVVYCHSGVRSAHTTFVLTQLLGYSNVKNYDGSWIEWSQFEDFEFEKDSLTTINFN